MKPFEGNGVRQAASLRLDAEAERFARSLH